ncbi:MAG TPA: shikimate dehydrogenase [Kofleriaceae bacterium]|nr:shikimate dehydrogenase [Kofleriaceae bacterium]
MIKGSTRVAAVIGWPVEHSRSPQLFEAAFAAAGIDAVMIPIGVPHDSLELVIGALRAMRALGASVTLPHKLAAAQLCDELSPSAREIGAANCLRVEGGRLFGHNTDCHGFTDALSAAGFAPEDKRCVILGAGGAARAVAYGLRAADAASIDVIARRPQRVAWTAARPWTPVELRGSFARADLLVDATPMGLHEGDAASAEAVPLDELRPGAWVATLVYHRTTGLIERAKQRGYSTVDGRGMLLHQGARAFALWTGTAPPIQAMQRALDAALDGT